MKRNLLEHGRTCAICGKGPTIGFNRPHSLHRTKKVVKPNLQKFQGVLMCTRCRRTILKKEIPITKIPAEGEARQGRQ